MVNTGLLLLASISGLLVRCVDGQTLTDCACYGNDPSVDSVFADCSASGGRLTLTSVYRGAKLNSLSCPNPASDADRNEANCCTYNANDDCKIDLTSTDEPTVYSDCTGSSTCTKQVTWMQTTGQCPQNVMSYTNYMCIDYECLPTTDELGFCDTAGTTLTSTTAYIADDNYPAGISHTDCCACVFTASANSATITIDVIEMTLYDVTTTCNQSILIESGTNTYTYNCTHNTDYTIQTLLTVTSTATVTLKNDAASVGNGRIWMRATVSNGGLTTTCGAVSTCPDDVTTTTTATAAAVDSESATTTVESTATTEKTLLFGLSVTVSAVLISLGFIILALLFVLTCILCYLMGNKKKKKININDSSVMTVAPVIGKEYRKMPTNPERPERSRRSVPKIADVPPPYSEINDGIRNSTAPYSTKLGDGYGKSSAMSRPSARNGMFVYRQYENRNLTHDYNDGYHLPRVVSP